MACGTPIQWVPDSLDSLVSTPGDVPDTTRLHSTSDGHADIAAHSGFPTAGRSGEQPSGILNATRSSSGDSHHRVIPDPGLGNPEQFDDAPYVPPRVTPVDLQAYSALDPSASNLYDDIQSQYPYVGGTSPSESAGSNWSNSSSSSASSQRLSHDYLVEPTYSQAPQPPLYPPHYPAYHRHERIGPGHVQYGEQPSNTGGSYYRIPPQGYAIDSLLSSEIFDDAVGPQVNYGVSSSHGPSSSSTPATSQLPNMSAFSVSPIPTVDTARSLFPDAGPQLRQQLGLSVNERVDLYSIPDPSPGEKPSTPLPMLVKLAIYGSPKKQLTLQEIYSELENRFEWFQEHKNEKAWKNSIRHNLSLNKVFKHVARPITEPGKGSYWQLDMSGGEGYKRLRKRRPKNRMTVSEEEDEEVPEEDHPSPSEPSPHAGFSRLSVTPGEDVCIDPELRSEGHVVGEGRSRSTNRRVGGGSPYPSHSPRYQHGPLPSATGQDGGLPGQHVVRFGQPSLGPSSFPSYPQTQPMPTASSSFVAMQSPPMTMAPTTSTVAHPQLQHMGSYDRTAPFTLPPLRSGIEYVGGPGGLPAARRVETYPESQDRLQGNTAHPSPTSSSSGSSRTWNDARSKY